MKTVACPAGSNVRLHQEQRRHGHCDMLTVSVIIPVYRSEQILPELYSQLSAAMVEITPDFEIIFIEDGGGDGSWPIIVSLARADHRVRGIRMSRNYGQHNALLCGIRAARYDIIVTM